jgi:hypothetical protein
MAELRSPSVRPEVLVDQQSGSTIDPAGARVGTPGPFGRDRLISALPTNKTAPVQLAAPQTLRDHAGCLIADPSGAVLGSPGAWCHRMVHAGRTAATRRF